MMTVVVVDGIRERQVIEVGREVFFFVAEKGASVSSRVLLLLQSAKGEMHIGKVVSFCVSVLCKKINLVSFYKRLSRNMPTAHFHGTVCLFHEKARVPGESYGKSFEAYVS
jgi:hypothetical protein